MIFTVHSCLSKSSTCISTAQARKICVGVAGACRNCALVLVPCAFSDMVVTFRGRRKGNLGNLVLWCSNTVAPEELSQLPDSNKTIVPADQRISDDLSHEIIWVCIFLRGPVWVARGCST